MFAFPSVGGVLSMGWEAVGRVQPVMIQGLCMLGTLSLIHSVPVSEVNCPYLTGDKLPKAMLLINIRHRVDLEQPSSETSLASSPAQLLQDHGQPCSVEQCCTE